MQIGRRWTLGDEPPAAVPAQLRERIEAEEAELARVGVAAGAEGWGWTLTYLEGEPVVELSDGTRLTLG